MLFMLAARRLPFAPSHVIFGHGNKLIETVEIRWVVIFLVGTEIGCLPLAKLLSPLTEWIKARVSL